MVEGGDDGVTTRTVNADAWKGHAGKNARGAVWYRRLKFPLYLNVITIIWPIGILDFSTQCLGFHLPMSILPVRSSVLADAADVDQQETTSSLQFRFIGHRAAHLYFASSNEGRDGLGVAG